MIAQLCCPNKAFIAGTFTLCISTNPIRTADVEVLRTVEVFVGLLSRHLDHEICRIAKAVYRCHIGFEFSIGAIIRLAHLAQYARIFRVILQIADRQIEAIVQCKSPYILRADKPCIEAVRVLFTIEVKPLDVIRQITVVVTVAECQAASRQMIYWRLPKQRHRQRISLCVDVAEGTAYFIIHTRNAKAERCSAASDYCFIVRIEIAQISVGNQCTSTHLVAVARGIMPRLLQTITIAPRALAPVVLHIKDAIRRFGFFNANRQLTRTKRPAGTQHTNSTRPRCIRYGIERRFKL